MTTNVCSRERLKKPTEEEYSLPRLQGNVPIQRVPRRGPGAHERRHLGVAELRLRRYLDQGGAGEHDELPQGAVKHPTQAVVPVLHGPVEGAQVECRDDLVALGEVVDVIADFDNITREIGTWDHVVLDGEGVFPRGDGKVPEVEGDASDTDQDFVG